MSLFEFLMVLVSLIIGLGVAELLTGVARVIRNRDSVRVYWVHGTFIVIVFLALLQQWWESWGARDVPAWTFLGLLMMLGGPIGLFLIAHLLFPEEFEGVDFQDYYYECMTSVLWIAIASILVSTTFRPVVFGGQLLTWDNLSSLLIMALFIVMVFTRNAVFHGVAAVVVLSALLADIILFNMEIR